MTNTWTLFVTVVILTLMSSGCSKNSSSPTQSTSDPSTSSPYWKSLAVPAIVNSATTDPSGNIWAGTKSGAYRSTDAGTTWVQTNVGMVSSTNVTAIQGNTTGDICAVVGSDLLAFKSGAGQWVNISQNINTSLIQFRHMNSFNLDRTGSIYASAFISEKSDPMTIGMDQNAFFKSTDGGLTWARVHVKQSEGAISSTTFDSKGDIFVIMDGNIYHSTDTGGSWTAAASGVGSSNPKVLSADSRDVVYAAAGSGVLQSTDKGISWTPANWTTYCVSLGINALDNVFIGGINKCYVSKDHAGNWTEISSGLSYSLGGFTDCVMQTIDKNGYAYAILESVLYRSVNSTTK